MCVLRLANVFLFIIQLIPSFSRFLPHTHAIIHPSMPHTHCRYKSAASSGTPSAGREPQSCQARDPIQRLQQRSESSSSRIPQSCPARESIQGSQQRTHTSPVADPGCIAPNPGPQQPTQSITAAGGAYSLMHSLTHHSITTYSHSLTTHSPLTHYLTHTQSLSYCCYCVTADSTE